MLRSSDDSAAEIFWNRSGGSAIITRVAARYGLTSTTPPGNGRWFNTISTTHATWSATTTCCWTGTGGLPPEQANIIMNNLASTPHARRHGTRRLTRSGSAFPRGFTANPLPSNRAGCAAIGADWMHLSTGVIGPDRRYVMAISSLQPDDDAAARATITQAVKTMFPGGRI